MNIILSIHPKWAKLIYEGKKTVEWRKNCPKKTGAMSTYFLYETAPVCKITGYVTVNGDYAADFNREHPINEILEKEGCVSKEELVKYQCKSDYIYAWQISSVRRFRTPRTLDYFGLKRPPQSWCYTEVDV